MPGCKTKESLPVRLLMRCFQMVVGNGLGMLGLADTGKPVSITSATWPTAIIGKRSMGQFPGSSKFTINAGSSFASTQTIWSWLTRKAIVRLIRIMEPISSVERRTALKGILISRRILI